MNSEPTMEDLTMFLATGLVIFNLSILLMEPMLFESRKPPRRQVVRRRH